MLPIALCTLACSPCASSKSADEGLHPKLVEGFTADLIAQAPAILWPSAVHCLSDGTLLVGEDRMDMPGPSDQPIDKLFALEWKPDGTYEKKLFAEQLFAVMGIQEVDDAVFVMNMPHLTRLRDTNGDHVADERVDILTDLGPPAPGWPGGFNDHIVTGLRLGMDGYIYVSVGDKGIPLAHGTDGSTITLRGGGIVRVKPDGSKLEIVSSGTRNHLDVAIDERGEMFTYDNTDDGLGWWTRVTHHIPGGYYGYPWDYHEHTDRMLPDMKDFGGGSPCGATFYREAVWPAPYRGSAYWCEWGKGVLRRFEFERKGASFAIKKDEDFMTAGDVPNFRPLDVSESSDGRFLFVADWGYSGWTNPAEAGRLWRVRLASDDGSPPKPLARISSAKSSAECVQSLEDPSFQRRLAAQRALSARKATGELIGELKESRSDVGRRHAIWGLAAIGDDVAHDAIRAAMRAPTSETRLQAARALGEIGDDRDSLLLSYALEDADVFVRRWCAWSLGRIRSDVGISRLLDAVTASDDPFLRWSCMRSLQWIRDWNAVVRALPLFDATKRQALWAACRDQYDVDLVQALVLEKFDDALASERVKFLASVWKKPEAWDGKWWSTQPAEKVAPPAKNVEWRGTELIRSQVIKALDAPRDPLWSAALAAAREMKDPEIDRALRKHLVDAVADTTNAPEARELAIVDVLTAHKDSESTPLFSDLARDAALTVAVRERVVDALAAIATPDAQATLLAVAADDQRTPDVIARCLRALGLAKNAAARPVAEKRLAHTSDSVRVQAVEALARVAGAESTPRLVQALEDRAVTVRCAAARALGSVKSRAAIAPLVRASADAAVLDEAVRALAEMPDASELPALVRGLDAGEPGSRAAAKRALSAVRDAVRAELESLATRGELKGNALLAVQEIYSTPQPIRAWSIVGPFAKSAGDPKLETGALDTAKPIEFAGAKLAWSAVEGDAENGFVDLEARVSKLSDQWAYATAVVNSAHARTAELRVGSDDQVTVWVNEAKVVEFTGDRGWSADQDRASVSLVAGSNRLLVRIGQSGGQWSFNVKLGEEGGGPIFEHVAERPSLDDYRKAALADGGDPARGAALFREKDRTLCVRCHAIGSEGAHVGPELSDIGAKYARDELASSILEPSKRIADGFAATILALKDERVLIGEVQGEGGGNLKLVDQNGELQELALDEIESRRQSQVSLMPEGLAQNLTIGEFADLVAYLASLKTPPEKPGVK